MAAVPRRGIHLDLKGLPPTPRRLLRLLDLFAAGGYNLVLVEWEDLFPWTIDTDFRCATAYSAKDLAEFVHAAQTRSIQLVPLVQCLGHLENFLSLPRYRYLREVDEHADTLHPLADGATDLIKGLIDDVLRMMPDVQYFHLGGDEAGPLGSHPSSRRFIEQHGGRPALYLKHVQPLIDYLVSRGIRPILWHDMMHDWPPDALRRLAGRADLMVWGYGQGPDQTTSHYRTSVIEKFRDAGLRLWAATAYKGADGCTMDLPLLDARAANATAWVELSRRIPFEGIVATGWSRYSAHRPQNEPIDGALDAMLYVGAILRQGVAPAGGIESCIQQLRGLGEAERFMTLRDALADLSAARREAWALVQQLREQIALQQYDPRRRWGGHAKIVMGLLCEAGSRAKDAAVTVRAALDGWVDRRWTDEYLHTRLASIDAEVAALTADLAQAGPQTPAPRRDRA